MPRKSWPTQEERPVRWGGPSFTLDIVVDGRRCLTLGGYRWRLAVWEGRLPGRGRRVKLPWATRGVSYGDGDLLVKSPSDWESVELEVVLDQGVTDDNVGGALAGALAAAFASSAPNIDFASVFRALPPVGALPVAANRDLILPSEVSRVGIMIGDLRFTELPSRQNDGRRAIAFGSRWVRVIRGARCLAEIWYPPSGYWHPADVRWPHGAVPSRSTNWYLGGPPVSLDDRLRLFLKDAVGHELYYATAFTTELDLWEQHIYRAMAGGKETFREFDLARAQRDLGRFAEYIGAVAFDHRAMVRRAEESKLFAGASIKRALLADADRLSEVLHPQRQRIREAFALLTSATAAHQLREAEEARRQGQALQDRIVFITTVVIVPSLIASVYGSDVHQLSNGYKGSLPSLVTYMLSGVLVSGSLVHRWFRSRTPGSGRLLPTWRVGIAIGAPSVGWLVYLYASRQVTPLVVGVCALGVAAALALA